MQEFVDMLAVGTTFVVRVAIWIRIQKMTTLDPRSQSRRSKSRNRKEKGNTDHKLPSPRLGHHLHLFFQKRSDSQPKLKI